MIKERADKIEKLLNELQKEYIAYYHEAKQYGMSWEQISKPTEILDTLMNKFESLNRFISKQVEVNPGENGQQTSEFKNRF